MESFVQDLRYAVRQLTARRLFGGVVIVTLALGVGANAAVFSLANWTMFRPVPGVGNYNELVQINSRAGGFSLPAYRLYAENGAVFSGVAGDDRALSLSIGSQVVEPKVLNAWVVTHNYFSVLGARLLFGRYWSAEEFEAAGVAPVAILSHRVWVESFHSNGAIVGTTIRANGKDVLITGVAEPAFEGSSRVSPADLWLPYPSLLALAGRSVFTRIRAPEDLENPQNGVFTNIIAKVPAGTPLSLVEAQVHQIAARVDQEFPPQRVRGAPTDPPSVRAGLGLAGFAEDSARDAIRLLAVVTSIVLLAAVANVANLLLFRAVQRRQEMAVKRALGATEARLRRQTVLEAGVLALVAGGAAVALSIAIVSGFRGLTVRGIPTLAGVSVDWRVLLFSLGLALVVGLAAGLLASWSGRSVGLALQGAAARGSARRGYVRSALGTVQLAAGLTLLVGALLLITTLRNLRSVPLGLDPTDVHVYSLDLASAGYTDEEASAIQFRALQRIRALPGVQIATLAPFTPFSGTQSFSAIWKDTPGTREQGVPATVASSTSGSFNVLRIPIVRGRDFTEAEETADPPAEVAIITQQMATNTFGTEDPLGRTIFVAGRVPQPYRVIGVVGDSRWAWSSVVRGDFSKGIVYRVMDRVTTTRAAGVVFQVRSSMASAPLDGAVKGVLRELAPTVPVAAQEMSAQIDRYMSEQRLVARAMTLLTLLAVTLAAVGLYALVSFSVAERTREFGIRIALGAEAGQVLNLVVSQGTLLAVLGIPLGLAGALAVSRMIRSRLFGVAPLEPHVYLWAVMLLVVVVLVASIIPARSATKVDPMVALRSE